MAVLLLVGSVRVCRHCPQYSVPIPWSRGLRRVLEGALSASVLRMVEDTET